MMTDDPIAPDEEMAVIDLVGGPPGTAGRRRHSATAVHSKRIKIVHGHGREHFELLEELPDHEVPTFLWTMRTKFAE